MKPITPSEVQASRKSGKNIPEFIINVVNELIEHEFNGRFATLRQEDIVAEIIKRNTHVTSARIYASRWLDFEEYYREAGWKVDYDKPGYNESYPATFTFSIK
jgi:hypothetical protein